MITKIGIKNFKCINDSGVLDIKPITLIFGPNNSGKSSILQNFLLLKQTFESSDPDVPLIINGTYIKLGSYQDFIRKHDLRQRYELQLWVKFEDVIPGTPKRLSEPSECIVNISYAYVVKSRKVYIQKYSICTLDNKRIIEWELNRDGKVTGVNSDVMEHFDKIKGKLKEIGFDHFPYALRTYTILGADGRGREARLPRRILQSLRNTFRNNLFYIGPLRMKSERVYMFSGEMPHEVGFSGEKTSEIVYMDKRMSPKKRKNVLGKIKRWMGHFGFFSDIWVDGYAGSPLFSMRATDARSGIDVNLADVGFGISQVMPTIVQGYFAPEHSTILMEQPEIHLHPKIQADFADMLLDIVKTNKSQVIVETHSEHILLRLRRRIAEGRLNASDVAIYYVEAPKTEAHSSHITPVKISPDGSMDHWPEDFFGGDIDDAIKMVEGRFSQQPPSKE